MRIISGNRLPILIKPKKLMRFVTPVNIDGLEMNRIVSKYYAFNRKNIEPRFRDLRRFMVSVFIASLILHIANNT